MKAAVILSGCGQKDGSEISEAILLFMALEKRGIEWIGFAPDLTFEPICHLKNGRAVKEKRHVLEESARLARGNIKDLALLNPSEFDLLCLPGGSGAGTILSNFFEKGFEGQTIKTYETIIKSFINAKKPIVAICISPAVISLALKEAKSLKITMGEEIPSNASPNLHIVKTKAHECVVDEDHKIVSTPAFMASHASRYDVANGIDLAVEKAIQIAK